MEDKPPETELDVKKRRQASPLFNKNRKDIFQFLCFRPCITASAISRELSISRATVSWHLNVLREAGYAESADYFGKLVFFPTGMLRDEKSRLALTVLNDYPTGMIFKEILKNPGIKTASIKELMETPHRLKPHLERLESIGLINTLRDGRNLRYYPTDKITELAKTEKSSLKTFRSQLVKKLEKEYLRPDIKEIKGSSLVITLHFGKTEEKLEIPYYPIERILV